MLPQREWDATAQPLLQWTIAPDELRISGSGTAFFQLIDTGCVLESVIVLPKPVTGSRREIFDDDGDINNDDRQMWVHTVGLSAFGET